MCFNCQILTYYYYYYDYDYPHFVLVVFDSHTLTKHLRLLTTTDKVKIQYTYHSASIISTTLKKHSIFLRYFALTVDTYVTHRTLNFSSHST